MSEKVKLNNSAETDDTNAKDVKQIVEKKFYKAKTDGYNTQITIKGKKYNADTYASPLQNNSMLPPIFSGLEVPSQTKGPFSHIDRERWMIVIEALLSRNVKSGRAISKLTGLSVNTSCDWVNAIKEMWSNDLTPQKVNVRREKLYSENERIADFCWNLIQLDPLEKSVPSLLKIIGDTNQRRSRLVGAEQITLNVGQTIEQDIDTDYIQTQAAAKLGISISSLKNIGDTLALEMIPSTNDEKEENKDEEPKD
jgi:hypothetical protein